MEEAHTLVHAGDAATQSRSVSNVRLATSHLDT